MGLKITKKVTNDNTQKLKEIINQLKGKTIQVGIFGSAGSDILMYAGVSEFGCEINVTPKMRAWLNYNGLHLKADTTVIHIPERSFIRKTANEKQDDMKSFIQESLNMLLTFQIDTQAFFSRVGQYLVQITQKTILDTSEPPNNPFTIERKGSSHPLIDSGRLLSAISYQVV